MITATGEVAVDAVTTGSSIVRARRVPDDVIDRLLDHWEVPGPGEAHEVTYVVR